jgi:dCTP deaminase
MTATSPLPDLPGASSLTGAPGVVGVSSVPRPVVLADQEIRTAVAKGQLRVDPYEPELVRPAALSLRLGRTAFVLRASGPVDTAQPSTYPTLEPRPFDEHGRLVVHPGEVVLAPTLERVILPDTLIGVLDGISDVARLGMSVVLAQQVSPGFGSPDGAVLTLEIVSRLATPVYLRPGTRICNLMLLRCAKPSRSYADMPHNHSGDLGAEPSKLAHYASAGLPVHTGQIPIVELDAEP